MRGKNLITLSLILLLICINLIFQGKEGPSLLPGPPAGHLLHLDVWFGLCQHHPCPGIYQLCLYKKRLKIIKFKTYYYYYCNSSSNNIKWINKSTLFKPLLVHIPHELCLKKIESFNFIDKLCMFVRHEIKLLWSRVGRFFQSRPRSGYHLEIQKSISLRISQSNCSHLPLFYLWKSEINRLPLLDNCN